MLYNIFGVYYADTRADDVLQLIEYARNMPSQAQEGLVREGCVCLLGAGKPEGKETEPWTPYRHARQSCHTFHTLKSTPVSDSMIFNFGPC